MGCGCTKNASVFDEDPENRYIPPDTITPLNPRAVPNVFSPAVADGTLNVEEYAGLQQLLHDVAKASRKYVATSPNNNSGNNAAQTAQSRPPNSATTTTTSTAVTSSRYEATTATPTARSFDSVVITMPSARSSALRLLSFLDAKAVRGRHFRRSECLTMPAVDSVVIAALSNSSRTYDATTTRCCTSAEDLPAVPMLVSYIESTTREIAEWYATYAVSHPTATLKDMIEAASRECFGPGKPGSCWTDPEIEKVKGVASAAPDARMYVAVSLAVKTLYLAAGATTALASVLEPRIPKLRQLEPLLLLLKERVQNRRLMAPPSHRTSASGPSTPSGTPNVGHATMSTTAASPSTTRVASDTRLSSGGGVASAVSTDVPERLLPDEAAAVLQEFITIHRWMGIAHKVPDATTLALVPKRVKLSMRNWQHSIYACGHFPYFLLPSSVLAATMQLELASLPRGTLHVTGVRRRTPHQTMDDVVARIARLVPESLDRIPSHDDTTGPKTWRWVASFMDLQQYAPPPPRGHHQHPPHLHHHQAPPTSLPFSLNLSVTPAAIPGQGSLLATRPALALTPQTSSANLLPSIAEEEPGRGPLRELFSRLAAALTTPRKKEVVLHHPTAADETAAAAPEPRPPAQHKTYLRRVVDAGAVVAFLRRKQLLVNWGGESHRALLVVHPGPHHSTVGWGAVPKETAIVFEEHRPPGAATASDRSGTAGGLLSANNNSSNRHAVAAGGRSPRPPNDVLSAAVHATYLSRVVCEVDWWITVDMREDALAADEAAFEEELCHRPVDNEAMASNGGSSSSSGALLRTTIIGFRFRSEESRTVASSVPQDVLRVSVLVPHAQLLENASASNQGRDDVDIEVTATPTSPPAADTPLDFLAFKRAETTGLAVPKQVDGSGAALTANRPSKPSDAPHANGPPSTATGTGALRASLSADPSPAASMCSDDDDDSSNGGRGDEDGAAAPLPTQLSQAFLLGTLIGASILHRLPLGLALPTFLFRVLKGYTSPLPSPPPPPNASAAAARTASRSTTPPLAAGRPKPAQSTTSNQASTTTAASSSSTTQGSHPPLQVAPKSTDNANNTRTIEPSAASPGTAAAQSHAASPPPLLPSTNSTAAFLAVEKSDPFRQRFVPGLADLVEMRPDLAPLVDAICALPPADYESRAALEGLPPKTRLDDYLSQKYILPALFAPWQTALYDAVFAGLNAMGVTYLSSWYLSSPQQLRDVVCRPGVSGLRALKGAKFSPPAANLELGSASETTSALPSSRTPRALLLTSSQLFHLVVPSSSTGPARDLVAPPTTTTTHADSGPTATVDAQMAAAPPRLPSDDAAAPSSANVASAAAADQSMFSIIRRVIDALSAEKLAKVLRFASGWDHAPHALDGGGVEEPIRVVIVNAWHMPHAISSSSQSPSAPTSSNTDGMLQAVTAGTVSAAERERWTDLSRRLPWAHTCSSTLFVPNYLVALWSASSSVAAVPPVSAQAGTPQHAGLASFTVAAEDLLTSKLLYAVDNCDSFIPFVK